MLIFHLLFLQIATKKIKVRITNKCNCKNGFIWGELLDDSLILPAMSLPRGLYMFP